MELVPCVHCSRHVGVTETNCPFCRRGISVQRPQFAFASKLTRAAIFSAAVVACDSKTAKPTPAPVPTQAGSATGSGSDDLEKMLDADGRTVERADRVTDAGAAEAMAAVSDGGLDGGVAATIRTPEEIRERKEQVRRDAEIVQEKVRKNREKQEELRIQHNAKPYGAPPARRRVV